MDDQIQQTKNNRKNTFDISVKYSISILLFSQLFKKYRLSPITRFCISILLMLTIVKTSFAQSLEYVENKGQWNNKVKFQSDMGGSVFFLQQQGYKVLLNSKEDLLNMAARYSGHFHRSTGQLSVGKLGTTPSKQILHAHAYEVNFVGSSSNATIVPDKPLNTYNNYYKGNDPSKWASNCKIYQAITY
ncbi:MAG TPA: hypothetical protein VH396_20895, partial [Chitinophagaceae bacterium]